MASGIWSTPPSNCESWYPPLMFISASTPPAELTSRSHPSSESSDSSEVRQARTVASMRSRATLVGTRPGDSHARTDCASHWAARGASHGAAGETFFAMELIRAIAWPALTSAIGLILGMSPRYRRTFPPVASTLSPSTKVLNVLTPVSFASACRRSWFGPMKQPPMSTGTPPSVVWVQTRPPTRSRASSTTTDCPAWDRRRAAVNPARPAPTTQTSASKVLSGMSPPPYAEEANMRAARM